MEVLKSTSDVLSQNIIVNLETHSEGDVFLRFISEVIAAGCSGLDGADFKPFFNFVNHNKAKTKNQYLVTMCKTVFSCIKVSMYSF